MLTRLEPDQISKFWDAIKGAIEMGLPPMAENDESRMPNVLASLLKGDAQAWVIEQKDQIAGVVVTMVLLEEMTQTKNLLIYSFAGYEAIMRETRMKALQELTQFAKGMDCHAVSAFTTHAGLVEMFKRRVPETKTETYISVPV